MLNSVHIQGRMTENAELKTTNSGKKVVSFTLAVERNTKDAEGNRQTDFINCVAWEHTAEFVANYFEKGQLLIAEGELQVRKWTDNNGNQRYSTEVLVGRAHFCGSKAKKEEQPQAAPQFVEYTDENADELPF